MFLEGIWTNHTGPKLTFVLAKKLRYYYFSLKDELLGKGCGERK
jgi:hypothetical protein